MSKESLFKPIGKLNSFRIDFINWYNLQNYKYKINEFLLSDLDIILGIIIKYLKLNNILIHADKYSYIVTFYDYNDNYAKDYIYFKKKLDIKESYNNNDGLDVNFLNAIYESFKFLDNGKTIF